LRAQVFFGICAEFFPAVRVAEIVGFPLIVPLSSRPFRIDSHPANRVFCRFGIGNQLHGMILILFVIAFMAHGGIKPVPSFVPLNDWPLE
jgi:hypothetical protein